MASGKSTEAGSRSQRHPLVAVLDRFPHEPFSSGWLNGETGEVFPEFVEAHERYFLAFAIHNFYMATTDDKLSSREGALGWLKELRKFLLKSSEGPSKQLKLALKAVDQATRELSE